MARTGRPTKCTPGLIRAVAARAELGVTAETACQSEGVSLSTWYSWKERGERGEQPYADFLEEIACARARGEVRHVEKLQSPTITRKDGSVEVDVNAILKVLERSPATRADWGQRVEVQVVEKVQRDLIERLRARLDPEAFSAVVEVLVGEDSE